MARLIMKYYLVQRTVKMKIPINTEVEIVDFYLFIIFNKAKNPHSNRFFFCPAEATQFYFLYLLLLMPFLP